MKIEEILKQNNVYIIDVREPYEFMVDRIFEAQNMPLSKFREFIDQIKKMEGKKVFYCRSGNRSGQVVSYLTELGIKEVYNGGSLFSMRNSMVA